MNGNHRWFWLGISTLWLLALGLRFWGLDRFNTLVFDEIYFAKFARNYLTQTPFFDAHPPLGKYMIALGIALKGFTPWGFRWMNAFAGSLIPLVIAGIAYQLTYRRSYALIAGGFAALDGLLLVESRYALLNVYLILFGLLGQWFLLLALGTKGKWHWIGLTLASINFGAAVAVKWNGLGFLLGIYLLWLSGWGLTRLGQQRWLPNPQPALPLQRLLYLAPVKMLVYLPGIVILVYSLLWIPHIQQNPTYGFEQVHRQILGYHQRVGSGASVHPYCAPWYTWPLMLRPIHYFYQQVGSLSESVPVIGPPLPSVFEGADQGRFVYNVYAMGNPILWWLSTLAMLWMGVWGLRSLGSRLLHPNRSPLPLSPSKLDAEDVWVPLYLGVNYAANLLPWVKVSRCTFLYHYLPATLFSGLAIAWFIQKWLHSPHPTQRTQAWILIYLIGLGFMFWLPLYLGLPLSPMGWKLRMWLPSWA